MMVIKFLKNKFSILTNSASEVSVSEDKNWIDQLVINIEEKITNGENIPFKIVGIKEKGFQVKVLGLYGYISMNKMPWKYLDNECWKYIYYHLTNKTFFCKAHEFKKNPLSIIINGEIPQFKKIDFEVQKKYKGIIVKKISSGIFVEFGYHFSWQGGSKFGFIHKSNFKKNDFSALVEGKITESTFCNYDEKDQPIFKNNIIDPNFVHIPLELMNLEVPVEVIKILGEKVTYVVLDKYKGRILVTKLIYPTDRKRLKTALESLNHKDIINCQVIEISQNKGIIHLKWNSEDEITEALTKDGTYLNSLKNIQNRVDQTVAEKLKEIGDNEE